MKNSKTRISIGPGSAPETPKIKSKQVCKEQTSDFLLLTYSKVEQAISYREELWNSSLTSSKEYLCDQCNNFHLRDIHGIPLASKMKFYEKPDSLENNNIKKERERCSFCKSSDLNTKAIFNDLLDAKSSLNNLSIAIKYEMYAYFCPYGNGIHLTKSLPKRAGQYIAALKQSNITNNSLNIRMREEVNIIHSNPKIYKIKKTKCIQSSSGFNCSECHHQLIYIDRLNGRCPNCNGQFSPNGSL